MAEAWAHHLFPATWKAASAGLLTYPISSRTRSIMQEVGLDMAGQHSKSIDAVDLDDYDLVVTLSDEAERYLPRLRDPDRHWRRPFADPMAFRGSPDEVRAAFRAGRQKAHDVVREVMNALARNIEEGPTAEV